MGYMYEYLDVITVQIIKVRALMSDTLHFTPCVLLSDLLSTADPLSVKSNLNYALYSSTCLERVPTSILQLKMLIFYNRGFAV